MQTELPRDIAEKNTRTILEWLAVTHGHTRQEEAQGLHRHLLLLRDTPLPPQQRLKVLDLLYGYASKVTAAQFPVLHEASLPVSHKIRQLARTIQDLLEVLAQDYLNTLADTLDPTGVPQASSAHSALKYAMQCLNWHLTISHLVAAPVLPGIWQQLHFIFQSSRKLGLGKAPTPSAEPSIERIYLSSLLISVAQPASFSSRELEFIGQYVDKCSGSVEISDDIEPGRQGIFWIDPEKDAPPHALTRRTPPPETPVYFFACDAIARGATEHLTALDNGQSSAQLGLAAFAQSHGGRGVLKRLSSFWGQPARRKFPRRRQSYRADLCAGLDRLWVLLHNNGASTPPTSEWMITNESPDGYAMMHVTGATEQLRVGDIVAVQPRKGEKVAPSPWQICIVRWALSENPEHIELGLQVLAGQGIPATLAIATDRKSATRTPALLLPEAPPLRPCPALIVPSGAVDDQSKPLVLLVEQENLVVRELKATRLDEQTSSIEMFSVAPAGKP